MRKQIAAAVQSESVDEVARSLITCLRGMGNARRSQGMQQYFKQEIVALGIATPDLRAAVRQRLLPLRGRWAFADVVRFADGLLRETEFELRAAGILALSVFRKWMTPSLRLWADRWLETRLDNWALVDAFCGEVLTPLLRSFPEVEAWLRVWSDSPKLWKRRASLVALVGFARRGERLDLAYASAAEHFVDPEDLMHKAAGWLLREAGKTDAKRLRRFLLEHGPSIPRTALRYAIERFPARERKELLVLTRTGEGRRSTPSPVTAKRRFS